MESSSSEEEKRDALLDAIFRTHVTDLYRYIYGRFTMSLETLQEASRWKKLSSYFNRSSKTPIAL